MKIKFSEFRKLIEKYQDFILSGNKKEAKEILNKLNIDIYTLKRLFTVKKHRVTRPFEEMCEEKGYNLKYKMCNITDKGYFLVATINNEEQYIIEIIRKKKTSYINLQCFYKEPRCADGVNDIINDYPELVDRIWGEVLKHINHYKYVRRADKEFEISRQNSLLEITDDRNMVLKTIERLTKEKQEIVDSFDEIDLSEISTRKV